MKPKFRIAVLTVILLAVLFGLRLLSISHMFSFHVFDASALKLWKEPLCELGTLDVTQSSS